jgi:site-specific DNA-methyltransferase (adenine-specific)
MEIKKRRRNMEINKIYNEDCLDTMLKMSDNYLDLTVTSPPYDNLREYKGYFFDFKNIAKELYRVTKKGGVVVWIVGDQTIKGDESGTSFKQALYFKKIGFNLHDTMIYQKNALPKNHNRYEQDFEYMFVFSKNKLKTFNPIKIPCKFPEKQTSRKNSYFSVTKEKNRSARSGKKRNPVKIDKIKGNIWYIKTGKGHSTIDLLAFNHPAIFPEQLANDHIISWSNENELIYDPFMGSGTTAKMAYLNNRKYIGSEISEEYCKIANERLWKYLNQKKEVIFENKGV